MEVSAHALRWKYFVSYCGACRTGCSKRRSKAIHRVKLGAGVFGQRIPYKFRNVLSRLPKPCFITGNINVVSAIKSYGITQLVSLAEICMVLQ